MLRIICFLFILTQVSCTIGQDNLDQVQADNLLLNLAPETNNTDWDREMKLDRLLTLLYNTDKDLANDILADLIAEKINKVLLLKTKESGVEDFYDWLQWLWNREELKSDYYLEFKANVYQNIDPKFHKYFNGRDSESSIRFDEVVWGGVVQDGIPPLRLPELINPDDADYLADTDVVFGFYINGVAKAYPKRILASCLARICCG